MKTNFNSIYLCVAGLVMVIVGSYIALTPNDYLRSLGVAIEFNSVNLLSDLRGIGGMLLVMGSTIFLSTFRKNLQPAALLMSTLVYGAFFIFRTVGFVFDGLPSVALIAAYWIEFILALMGMWLANGMSFFPKLLGEAK